MLEGWGVRIWVRGISIFFGGVGIIAFVNYGVKEVMKSVGLADVVEVNV